MSITTPDPGGSQKQDVRCGIQVKSVVLGVPRRFRNCRIRGACQEQQNYHGLSVPGVSSSAESTHPASRIFRKTILSLLNMCRHSFFSSFPTQYSISTFYLTFTLDEVLVIQRWFKVSGGPWGEGSVQIPYAMWNRGVVDFGCVLGVLERRFCGH